MYYHPILNVQYHSILQPSNHSPKKFQNRKKFIRGRIGIKNSRKFTTIISIEFVKSSPRFHFLNYVHKCVKIHKLK